MGTSVIPNLMPGQMFPFNDDHFLEETFLKLKEEFGITTVIETGTCFGSTTIWLARNFDTVMTIENNSEYLEIARDRFHKEGVPVRFIMGDSAVELPSFLEEVKEERVLLFCDAHWGSKCPLINELEAVALAEICPVLVLHDFMVPNRPDLGYDEYNGQKFELSWVLPQLEKIYKDCGMSIRYNKEATGARRGVLICCPLKQN